MLMTDFKNRACDQLPYGYRRVTETIIQLLCLLETLMAVLLNRIIKKKLGEMCVMWSECWC